MHAEIESTTTTPTTTQTPVQNYSEEEYMYSQLQFQQFLVEPESKVLLDVFLRDLNLTCFNELDIYKAREIIELINDLTTWGLKDAAALFKPTLYNLVNTARSRGGFERNALNTKRRLETANITQNLPKESMIKKFITERRRR